MDDYKARYKRCREAIKEYIDFMYNKDNAYKCDKCPENISHSGSGCNGNPCGRLHCQIVLYEMQNNESNQI